MPEQMPASKNIDPHGCPDTVIGDCEAMCARCGRDMQEELSRLRGEVERLADALRAAVLTDLPVRVELDGGVIERRRT